MENISFEILIEQKMGLENAFRFLKALKKNNRRDWMLANKEQCDTAKKEAIDFVEALLVSMKPIDSAFPEIPAESCLFRIHRDVRFSKNKDPYKTNFGFSLNLYGRKSFRPGFYLHLEPGGVFLAAGMFQPPNDVLAKVRAELDFQATDFLKIVNKPAFVERIGSLWEDDKLVKVPKGFKSESPVAEFLKLKSLVAAVSYSDLEVKGPHFSKQLVKDMKLLWTFIQFLNQPLN